MPVQRGAEPFLFVAGAPAVAGVVLCHGFAATPLTVRPWGEYLHAAGFSVACPRLPGHGTRWQDLDRTRWEDWYGELERAFDAMLNLLARSDDRPGDRPVFAAGVAMGGTLVTRLGEQRGDEVAGLVPVDPAYLTLRRDAALLPVLSRLIPSRVGLHGADAPEFGYDRLPPRAARSLQALRRTVRIDLAKVVAPVQVYRRSTHRLEPVNTRLLLDGVSSTEAEEVVLDGRAAGSTGTADPSAEALHAGSLAFFRRCLRRLGDDVPPGRAARPAASGRA